jgi:RNA polymerase sigma-70 factor (ECF subfamily)
MEKEQTTAKKRMSDPETWVDQYGDYLYHYALSRIHNPTVAEDLVQETFLAALNSRKNFEGLSSERTWLTSILKHKTIDHIRKMVREQPQEDFETFRESENDLFDEKGRWKMKPADWNVNPEKLMDRKEFWGVINKCLSDLPTRLEQAFRLREMDGFDCKEICNVLDITASNCWVMLYRARASVRHCMEINWFGTNNKEDT